MMSYPIVAMVWEGVEVVSVVRKMIGTTQGRTAEIGTIRGDFAMSTQMNLIHASEDAAAAEKELHLLFEPTDLHEWQRTDIQHIYGEEEL